MYTDAALTTAPSSSIFTLASGKLTYSSSDTSLHGQTITIYIKGYHQYNTQS